MANILVIEDDTPVLKLICQILESDGYSVLSAKDGEEGIALFHENSIDLIITDMLMPNKDGVEVILEIKELLADVGILAISGGGRGMDARLSLQIAKEFGAVETLAKPFSRQELLDAVSVLLEPDVQGL
ncbi:MAG: response regulator [Magnetococcales bacterium]|nr:response regulator [Magnetococcales bacterium]